MASLTEQYWAAKKKKPEDPTTTKTLPQRTPMERFRQTSETLFPGFEDRWEASRAVREEAANRLRGGAPTNAALERAMLPQSRGRLASDGISVPFTAPGETAMQRQIRELNSGTRAKVSDLEEKRRRVQPYTQSAGQLLGIDSMSDKYGDWERKASRIDEELKNLRPQLRQNEMEFYSGLTENPDFLENVRSNPGTAAKDDTYAYINSDPAARGRSQQITPETGRLAQEGGSAGDASRLRKVDPQKTLQYMDEVDIALYNYIYETQGKTDADDFLKAIADGLNYRRGAEVAQGMEGKAAQQIGYGVNVGLDRFGSGVKQFFTEEPTGNSYIQHAGNIIREDLRDTGPNMSFFNTSLGQLGYDVVQTSANMAPSILLSSLLGPGGLGVIGGSAARGLGAATLGGSAAGNAYSQAVVDGYSPDQARLYGALVGLSEGGLQYVLGGIGALGSSGSVSARIAQKIQAIDNTVARVALQVGNGMAFEGLEEGLQEILDPMFRTLVLNEEYSAATVEEVLYAALLGALSAGPMNAPGVVGNEMNTRAQGEEFLNISTDVARAIVEQGLVAEPESASRKMAEALQPVLDGEGKVGALQIGRLYQQVMQEAQNAPAPQNEAVLDTAKIAAKLVSEEGMTPKAAQGLAETVAAVVRGEEISGKKAVGIARSDAATAALEAATGQTVQRDAPISEVRSQIQGLSTRAPAPAPARTAPQIVHDVTSVRNMGAILGKAGGTVITDMYDGATARTTSAEEYVGSFLPFYHAGEIGADFSTVPDNGVLTPAQKQAAFEAGVADRVNTPTPAPETDETNGGLDSGQEERAGDLPVHGSSERQHGSNPGLEGGRVAEGAGRDQSGQETERWSNGSDYGGRAAPQGVSAKEVGLIGGTDNIRNRVLKPNEYTEAQRAIVKDNEEHGLRTVLVRGDFQFKTTSGEIRYARGAFQSGTIYVQVDNSVRTAEQINMHERFHAMVKQNAEVLYSAWERVIDAFSDEELRSIVTQYEADYNNVYDKSTFMTAVEEMLADAYSGMLVYRGFESIASLQERIVPVVREAVEQRDKTQKTADQTDGGARFSLERMPDGTPYVEVNVDQHLFDGVPVRAMRKIANQVIQERFRGKVIGSEYTAYVNKRSGEEFSSPANRRISDETREAKMRTSPELDVIMEASEFLENVPDDGRHPEAAGGWDYLRTRFMVGGRLYQGTVSIMLTNRGRIFYDVTKIKDITRSNGDLVPKKGTVASPGDVENLSAPIDEQAPINTPETTSGTVSTNSISSSDENSNTGFSAEGLELSDQNTRYSLRTAPPPQKIGVAYKVFYAKDGNLYPPMVANPNGAGTPVGVWLDADIGLSAPASKTGRPQVQGGGKGTATGKVSLSFRPGWHLGGIPLAKQFARTDPITGQKTLFPASFVWAECEYAMDKDYQDEAMSYGYTENGKFRHAYAGLPKVPTDGYYRYRTNPNPDTVPWIITGAMRVTRILTDAETDAICRENGVEPMARQGGDLDLKALGLEPRPTGKNSEKFSLETIDSAKQELARLEETDALAFITEENALEKFNEHNKKIAALKRRIYALEHPKSEAQKALEAAQKQANTALDSRYFEAIEAGNLEAAQEMVLARAREQGYTPARDYHIDHTAPTNDGYNAPLHELDRIYPDDIYSLRASMYYGDANGYDVATMSALQRLRGKPDAKVDIFRAVPAEVKESQIRNGDWVTVSRQYAQEHGEAHIDGEYRIISNKVPAKHVFTDGNSIHEQGYDNGQEMAYANTKNNAKLLDAITYDSAGAIIPLSKRFNSRKAGANYSLNDGPVEQAARALQQQNNALQKEVDRYKGKLEEARRQTKRTEVQTTDRKSVEKLAKGLAKEYSSEIDLSELTDELQAMSDYLLQKDEILYSDVKQMALRSARDVLDSASILLETGETETWTEIRNYLRNTSLYVGPDTRADIDFYNDFRKQNFGRLKLTGKNGLPIDVAYMDLTERFGEVYFPSDITHPSDQLTHMSYLLDGFRDTYGNPFASNILEATEYLANDMVDRVLDLPQTAATFADKQAQKVNEVRAAGNRKVSEVRREKNEKIAKIQQENSAKVKEILQRERGRRETQMTKLKESFKDRMEKGRDRRAAAELRRKIVRHVQQLSQKLLKPTDARHIPQQLREPVAVMLDAINLESQFTVDPESGARKKNADGLPTKRTEAFLKLKQAYAEIVKSEKLLVDPDMQENFDAVIANRDVRLNDMNLSQLETVWRTIRAVEASITNANKLLANEKYTQISELGEVYRDYAKEQKKKKTPLFQAYDNLVNVEMMTPVDFMERLGDAGVSVWRSFQRAADKETVLKKATADFGTKLYGDMDIKKWSGKKAELHTFELSDGKIQLTTAQIMYLYAANGRNQARRHIYGEGIFQGETTIKGKTRKGESSIRVTEDAVKAITDKLTPEQKRVADEMVKYMSETVSGWMNEQTMALYGYEKFNEKHYIPIRTDPNSRASEPSERSTDIEATLAGKGFTKATQDNAQNALVLDDIFDVFYSHTNDASIYAAWLATLKDSDRFYDFKYWERGEKDEAARRVGSVSQDMEYTLGKGAQNYWKTLVRDLNGGNRAAESGGFAGWLTRNYKAAAVGANLRVVIQQPTAILRASAMIDPKYLARALPGQNAKEMLEHAPIALWKDWGYSQFSSGKQLRELVEGTDSVREGLIEKSMWAAGKADQLAWAQLWTACKLETKAKNPDMKTDSDDFFKKVTDRFTDIIYHTQVVDSILTRSQAMRSKDGLYTMATAFMSEPTRSFNMMRTATWEALHGATPQARNRGKRKLFRTGMAVLASQMVNAFILSLYDAVGDEEDESYWDKVLRMFTGIQKSEDGEEKGVMDYALEYLSGNFANSMSTLGKMYFVKDLLSMIDGYDVSRMDMANVGNMVDAFKRLGKATTEDANRTVGYALADSFAHASSVFGLPVAKVKREAERGVKGLLDLADFAGADASMLEYAWKKVKVPLNNANRNTYIDMAYGFEQNGAKSTAAKIYKDLIAAGVTAQQIESRKKSLRKGKNADSYTPDPFAYADASAGYRFSKQEDSGPTALERMTEPQYRTYARVSESTYNSIMGSAKNYGAMSNLSNEALDGLVDAALKYSQEHGKAEALRNYEVDVKWMQWADAGAPSGIDQTEAILYRLAYEMATGVKDANGKTISGSKKEESFEIAREYMPWLTPGELEYLGTYTKNGR